MTVTFLDLDATVVKQGTREELSPGTFDKVRQLIKDTQVYFFSCWAFNDSDMTWLFEQFPGAAGVIRKPLADKYVFIDDKLDLEKCAVAL